MLGILLSTSSTTWSHILELDEMAYRFWNSKLYSGRTMVFCEAYIMVIWTHKHFLKVEIDLKGLHIIIYSSTFVVLFFRHSH